MKKIKNNRELLSVGDKISRQIVLEILDETLQRLDSYKVIKQIVSVSGNNLKIGNKEWDLSKKRNVYIIGAGKATNSMAMAFDQILGSRLTDGIIIVKMKEEDEVYRNVRVYTGGHPLPNQDGFAASLKILDLVDRSNKDDLFIGLMSGGCSSLMSCPMESITLQEEIQTRDVMLKSGASVIEVNAVCRHISRVNGGRLAKRIEERGGEIITLLIMDAMGFPATKNPGEPVHFGFTQLAPDATTLEDAKAAIKNYNVEHLLPNAVADFYNNCTDKDETPKSLKNWTGFIINTLPDASNLAREASERCGIPAFVLTNYLSGEAREAGTFLGSIAQEIQENQQPVKAPCVIIATGEVSTKIPVNHTGGLGGPGQELATSFSITACKVPGVCLASVDTEGTDGPTNAAGGITDSKTLALAKEKNIDLYQALREHTTYAALSELRCKIVTGNTGTNLCDLHIMYVPIKSI